MRTYGTLTQKEGQWVLDAAPHVVMRAKRLFGKLSKKASGKLKLSHNPETCRDLEWFLTRYPLDLTEADRAALAGASTGHRDLIARLEDLLDPNYEPPTFALAKPPRSYQAREAAIYLETGGLLVGDDVGLGKTVSAIASFADPRTLPAVVVCLTHLPRQWQGMIKAFAPNLRTHILKKGTPYELPKFFGRQPDVLILNYHKLAGWAQVLSAYAKSIVFDEMQELRHSGTARYSAASVICQAVPFKLGLTATPTYNYGGEIYDILNLLRPGALGEYSEFYQEWCTGSHKKVKLKDPKAFGTWAREQFLLVRHTRKDVGRELPAVQRIPQHIDTDRKALDEVEDTVLAGWHRAAYDIWLAKLRDLNPVLYTGSETASQKDAAVQAFLSGKSKVFILSLRSGVGIDGLQQISSCVVFGELDWSPYVMEQVIGRLDRDGQKSPVVAYFLLTDDGSDPAMAEILGIKREQGEGIRNPTETFIERVDISGDHARRLAAAYLRQIGQPIPENPNADAWDEPPSVPPVHTDSQLAALDFEASF